MSGSRELMGMINGFRGLSQVVEVWEAIGARQRGYVKAGAPSLAQILDNAEQYMAQIEHERSVNEEQPLDVGGVTSMLREYNDRVTACPSGYDNATCDRYHQGMPHE